MRNVHQINKVKNQFLHLSNAKYHYWYSKTTFKYFYNIHNILMHKNRSGKRWKQFSPECKYRIPTSLSLILARTYPQMSH